MSSSTRTDINYFSIGEQYVFFAGSDHPQTVDSIPTPPIFTPENPSQYAAILKASGSDKGIWIDSPVIAQGHENAIDINNRSKNIKYSNATIGATGENGDQVITIKGGSTDIQITGVLHTRGNRQSVDVDVGNWSDQSYNNSERITLNLTHVDGKKINVRIGRAKNVILLGSCKQMVFASLVLKAYWWFKWLVRKVLKIPVGTKGPSWL